MRSGIRGFGVAVAFAGLAGCVNTVPSPNPNPTVVDVTSDNLDAEVGRAYDSVLAETPFARGPVSVIVTENDKVRTYRLLPCNGGTAICSGTVQGRAGSLTVTPDHYIVQGLYGDRTFFLRPGGGGTMRRGNVDVPLAWDSFVNGVPRLVPETVLGYQPTYPYSVLYR